MAKKYSQAGKKTKDQQYQEIVEKMESLLREESDYIAVLSTLAAHLKNELDVLWAGFYVAQHNELRLGPFQGPTACTRIQAGNGVCGKSFNKKGTIIVKNVHDFPGHIACSPDSKSEIVVPVIKKDKVLMVIDIDSKEENHFDETDQQYLEKIAGHLAGVL